MKFPLRSQVQIGKYVASNQRKGDRYPLVLMLEPTLACNIACIGCGKIREYESNKARLSVEESGNFIQRAFRVGGRGRVSGTSNDRGDTES